MRLKILASTLIALVFITDSIFAQQEQAGIDLVASFPAITSGNVKPDVPANGYYWDKDHSGWGIGIEIQSRPSADSGYFMFATGYFYDEQGKQFWCAISEPFIFNEDVNQWRDQKDFSNLPNGHDELPVLAEMDVKCNKMEGGSSLDSASHQNPIIDKVINLNFLWRNPSELEITTESGTTLYTSRFAWHDDFRNPSIDWVLDNVWSISSSVVLFENDNNDVTNTSKTSIDNNLKTKFEKLDVSNQGALRDFIGHKEHYVYYISTLKYSTKRTTYFNYDHSLANKFEPYVDGGSSNFAWIVLVHDSEKNTVSSYTVFGEKNLGALLPNLESKINFRASVNPDADIIDFYPLLCEGANVDCQNTVNTNKITDMANFSPQNIHRSTMKMFKIKTGGDAYLYQPNNGEADDQSTIRIKDQLTQNGVINQNQAIPVYNQAYQENFAEDNINDIKINAQNAYVLLDPFMENINEHVAAIKAKNNQLGAYISIGTGEDWRLDFSAMQPYLVSKVWGEWAGEYFVNTTTTGIIDLMKTRIELIANWGYDWVEFDNMDWIFDENYRETYGFVVTQSEGVAYFQELCDYVHSNGMKCMAKNITLNADNFDGALYESYNNKKNWWDQSGAQAFLDAGKLVIINHYNETNCSGVYLEYKGIYNDNLSFICEDANLGKYVHYNE